MKNSLTPAGIEPVTFRFVAQHLNHCTTAITPVQTLCFALNARNPTRCVGQHTATGVHRFSKNVGASSDFLASEG